MPTLAADKSRHFSLGDIESYPTVADDIIYLGAAVGENAAGYARPLQAGDTFLGFASDQAALQGMRGSRSNRAAG